MWVRNIKGFKLIKKLSDFRRLIRIINLRHSTTSWEVFVNNFTF